MQENSNFDIKKVLKTTMKNCKYYYNKEEGFRIDVVRAINELYGDDAFVLCEYSVGNKKSIDIVVGYNNKKYAIELKYRANIDNKTYKKYGNLKYKITKGDNLYEYIVDDINKKMLDKDIIKNENFEDFYAVILTNSKEFDNEDKVKNYCRRDKSKYLKRSVNIKKLEIKNGYYSQKENDFYLICSSLK